MPAPTSTADLLLLVRKSELVPAPRLERFLGQTPLPPSPHDLAVQLVLAGLVTQFQSEQLLQGKWRGFTIGKYRVLERVGSGGMGTVYLCEHQVMGSKVAVKVLPTNQADNPSSLGRFYREARAAGQINHPNLVKAHDVDQDNGLHFLVMDYVDGSSLHEIVTRFGPLPVDRAANYVCQAALGLQAAHEAGLIHRDVKPANVMLERNGTVRVLDLGLARFHEDQDLLTLKYDENNVLGTADYVAPEQAINSHDVDIRADVYGLGCTFYFLLTGQPVFPGGKIAQKLVWHQMKDPTPVRKLRPEVPEELAGVLAKMIAKRREDRYQTPGEVAAALAPWAGEPVSPPRDDEMPRLSPAAAGVPSAASPEPRHPASLRRQPTVKAALPRQTLPGGPPVAAHALAGQVTTLQRPRAAEPGTPRTLASVQTPANSPRACPVEGIAPSRLLDKVEAARQAESGRGGSLLWFAVVAVLGASVGLGLGWLLLQL